ncbi:MAG: heavy metal sensor histidine kinase [Candidatus Accumulibacter sp.]|nr:heavy metal sensor histidine kinase [Accumulibacter sp.]
MSLSWRLRALFATVSTIVLLILGTLIGRSVENHFEEQDRFILDGKLVQTRRILEDAGDDPASVPQRLDEILSGAPGLAIAVRLPGGETLFATSGVDFPGALFEHAEKERDGRPFVWASAKGVPLRGISARFRVGKPGRVQGAGDATALVGAAIDISHHESFMRAFRQTLWAFIVLAAVSSGFLGWLAVRHGLSPLRAMKRQAEKITAERLDARLSVDDVPIELADLARTLNALFSRLEKSFIRLSEFSSDLAHEFRTPVSNLLMQTQVTLSRERGADEYRDVLASNIDEFERLSRMIADMLFIAKASEGRIVPTLDSLELAALVTDVADFHRLAADEKNVTIDCEGRGTMRGDSLMIRRVFSNLFSNAIRHAPSGGWVRAIIDTSAEEEVTVAVANEGETIPEERLFRLFDRFYRAETSRARGGAQSGLGLAIVKSIVEAHGGRVEVASKNRETTFRVAFPSKTALRSADAFSRTRLPAEPFHS